MIRAVTRTEKQINMSHRKTPDRSRGNEGWCRRLETGMASTQTHRPSGDPASIMPTPVASIPAKCGLGVFTLVLFNLLSTGDCHIRAGHGPHMDVHPPTLPPPLPPQLDPTHSTDVTALADKTAILNCRVHNIANNTVSWIRHRDIHLLTVGKYTYTSDQRFRALHEDDSDDWVLKINYVQTRDTGMYECQISTTPPLSHFIRLSVVKPYTHILGGPDMYINKGSTINLTCVVEFSPEPPDFIYWNHNNKIISYDSTRGGVTVIIEKGDVTTSSLLIQKAQAYDSGRYNCNPSNAAPANVTVHVLNEHPAAMQHGGQGTYTSSSVRNILTLLALLVGVHTLLQ
ncbi:limbic system-associated membrane protein isoform X2 [Cherax quadricarinatus]|uniref:limbic system-associated membrane protein isoform X2 n=1 Tax=Cherax quadricarinatus TaxID=27406 RepID=UPI00387EA055